MRSSSIARASRCSDSVAIASPDDELGDHRIVVDRDLRAAEDAGVVAHPRALRQPQALDLARRRRELAERILGVEADLDRMSARLDIVEFRSQRFALRDGELRDHDVEPGHHLGHRMLDLEAGVHLQEVEVAGGVEQELAGAGVGVPDRLRRRHGRRAHAAAELRRDHRRWRLFDDLLMAALERALALAERNDPAVVIAENLDLDVPRTFDELLEEDRVVTERRAGLGTCQAVALGELGVAAAPPACPCRRRRPTP